MRGLDALLPLLANDLAAMVAGFSLPYGLLQLVAGLLGDPLSKPCVAARASAGYALATRAAAAAPDLLVL